MKKDIVNFIHSLMEKYRLEAIYFPDDDIYSIRFFGRAVQNFNSKQFYSLPKRHRMRQIVQILKLGLSHNVGERSLKDRLYLNRNLGKKIIK